MTAYFVTATGTDIGKTYVTAGILRAAMAAGREALAIKPILSGYDPLDADGSDPAILLAAMSRPVSAENIATISPWRFAAALSPCMAAARESRSINTAAVVRFCEAYMQAARGLLLIEGVGGAMVPLNESHTVCDWMAALNVPVILVAGSYLGTISHTLTTVAALQAKGIIIEMIVLSESVNSPVSLEETAAVVARFLPDLRIKIIPRDFNNVSFRNLASFLTTDD